MNEMSTKYNYVVIGGGIAAVCCVEQLANLDEESNIIMLSASKIVKSVSNVQKIGREMESFDVAETSGESLFAKFKNVNVVHAYCVELNAKEKCVTTKDGRHFLYDKLCIATGGIPKFISDKPYVIGIRDTETVKNLQHRLSTARRIVIVGNGGIATELVYEVDNIEVIWVVKHKSISATFVDAGAAEFFISHLNKSKNKIDNLSKRLKYTHSGPETLCTYEKADAKGSALGPDWIEGLQVSGLAQDRRIHIEFECEVDSIFECTELKEVDIRNKSILPSGFIDSSVWPVYVKLTNGAVYGCDFIISATGVTPFCPITVCGCDNQLQIASDGGILVDNEMRTNLPSVYAAGDVCTAGWEWSPHWIQMRLWTQARQMGAFAGRCMFNNSRDVSCELDICFEIFTHVTNFFAFKVILLGKFNSQDLRPDHEAHVRVRKNVEYVKILVQDGKVQGAILIGETDLEETFENLILNQTDVSHLGEDLLNSTVDIEDYFD